MGVPQTTRFIYHPAMGCCVLGADSLCCETVEHIAGGLTSLAQTLSSWGTLGFVTHISKCPPRAGTTTSLGATVLNPLTLISLCGG